MEIRVAWINKRTNRYSYGDWRDKKQLFVLKKWILEQNAKYSHTYYWIETLENNKIKNFNWEINDYEYVTVN